MSSGQGQAGLGQAVQCNKESELSKVNTMLRQTIERLQASNSRLRGIRSRLIGSVPELGRERNLGDKVPSPAPIGLLSSLFSCATELDEEAEITQQLLTQLEDVV